MERTSILLLLLALVAVRADTGNLWPLPQSSSVGSEYANLNPSTFQFKCIGSSCTDVLKEAFKRYHHYIFFAGDSTSNAAASLSSILVNASSSTKLDLDMDESYTLTVNSTTAVITSNTEWGALRGLETFSQLTDWNYNTDTYFIASLPVSIQDSPRFKWRGLLIDTSRHYLPLSQIYKAVDALAFDKFNVLHWHIVDAQSFPYQSQVFPLLTHGAWIPKAIYTPADVKSVIQYAYNRGVRVVPEIDTPGHSASWGVGYPQLFPKCTQKDVLNPTTDYTMSFVKSFFQEISTVFSDHYMHMGGDEVTYDCWKQDPSIATWMAKNNIADYKGLQAYYETQVEKMVNGYGKIPIFWEEVYDNSPSGTLQFNTTVVNVWFSANTKIAEVVKAGYRATYSTPWYLDKELPDSETFYEWEDTWIAFYNSEPLSGLNLTPQEEALVLGGEASMWGEQVDETSFDVRVWPRASAIAERLWSSKSVVDHNAATPRLGTQRCRMVRRGINASPVYPDYCTTKADKTISIDEIIV